MSDGSQGEGWWLASDGKSYPPQPPVDPVAQTTNGLAIASMVLGILWLFWIGSILAIVFGHISLGQIKKSPVLPDMGWRGSPGLSLRAGFVSGCDRRSISTSAVRVVTGHQSDAMLSVYTRPRSLFESSAGAIFNDRE